MLRKYFCRSAQLDELEVQAHAWVRRLASNRVTEADLQALAHWHSQSPKHADAFAQARQQWRLAGKAGQLVRGYSPLRGRDTVDVSSGRRAWLGLAMGTSAVAVAVAAYPPWGLWPALDEWNADYATGTGEQREVAIDDEVLVALNTQTRIAMRQLAGIGKAMELLRGEAAVDLRSSEPFTVLASGGRAQSSEAGARFEVRKIGDQTCVTCMNGTVSVRVRDQDIALLADQQVFYGTDGLGKVVSTDAGAVSAWRAGILVFRRSPLTEVIAEINRYRPGRIVLLNERKAGELLNGQFRINRLDDALVQISHAFGMTVRQAGGIVVLT